MGLISIMTDEGESILEGAGHMLGMLMAKVHERSRPVPLRLALGQTMVVRDGLLQNHAKYHLEKVQSAHPHLRETPL